MLLDLIVGDWSHDGHEKTTNFVVSFKGTIEKLDEAYKKGTEILGFDITKEVATEYEETRVLKSIEDKLKEYNIILEDTWDEKDYEPQVGPYKWVVKDGNKDYIKTETGLMYSASMDIQEYIDVYLLTCRLGGLEITEVDIPSKNIGGYGFFY